jgi:hypothetical protein
MSLSDIKQKWQAFVDKMNKYGVPVPTVRDPRTGTGSITAALVVFSAGLFGFCIIFMLASTIVKWAGFFALTDLSISQVKTAADYSFQFLLAALGGYLGRHLQKGESIDPAAPPAKAAPKVDNPDQ